MNYNITRATKKRILSVDLGCWWRPFSVGWTTILEGQVGVLGRQTFFNTWVGLIFVTLSLSVVATDRVRWEENY